MTEEYAEKMGWLESDPEPYTSDDLDELYEEFGDDDPDPGDMDGDATSALASAGWGTDEDYGYYGEEF
jgi:hypothetical protein